MMHTLNVIAFVIGWAFLGAAGFGFIVAVIVAPFEIREQRKVKQAVVELVHGNLGDLQTGDPSATRFESKGGE